MPISEAQSPAVRRTNPHANPNFFEALSIADCLAQKFAGAFPTKEANPNWRAYLRSYTVPGLRWLWRHGNADMRTTLAARVAVWRNRKSNDVQALQGRILARELARTEKNCPASQLFPKPAHMTYADADYLVETIQEATRGCTIDQKLEIASEWEWMANELRRVLALEGGAL